MANDGEKLPDVPEGMIEWDGPPPVFENNYVERVSGWGYASAEDIARFEEQGIIFYSDLAPFLMYTDYVKG